MKRILVSALLLALFSSAAVAQAAPVQEFNVQLKDVKPDGRYTIAYSVAQLRDLPKLRADLLEHVVKPVLPSAFAGDDFRFLTNPTGSFVLGGPHADTGLTGVITIPWYFSGGDPNDPGHQDESIAWFAATVIEPLRAQEPTA